MARAVNLRVCSVKVGVLVVAVVVCTSTSTRQCCGSTVYSLYHARTIGISYTQYDL